MKKTILPLLSMMLALAVVFVFTTTGTAVAAEKKVVAKAKTAVAQTVVAQAESAPFILAEKKVTGYAIYAGTYTLEIGTYVAAKPEIMVAETKTLMSRYVVSTLGGVAAVKDEMAGIGSQIAQAKKTGTFLT